MRKKLLPLLALCVTGTFCQSYAQGGSRTAEPESKLQFGFIENKGQILNEESKPAPEVLYLLNAPGLNVQLRKNGFSYDTYVTDNIPVSEKLKVATATKQNIPSTEYRFHRVDITLEGSNPSSQIVTGEAAPDYINYYTTGVENGALDVHHYNTVTYKNIYPGIDLEFTASMSDSKLVEYNFIVHPGADAGKIKLHYEGANATQLVNNTINIKVAQGSFNEVIPASFTASTHKPVSVSYTKTAENTYGYSIGIYDKTQTLIIDPTPQLSYASYYGGTSGEFPYGMSVSGTSMYIAGLTLSSANIATTGTHQSTYNSLQDGFIAKFSLAGVRTWATYYGNTGNDAILGIASAANGNVFVGGQTQSSSGFASSSNVMQPTFGGTYDGFFAKFNSSGIRQWGTYLGGVDFETIYSLTLDATGDIAFTGVATPGSPYVTGAFKTFVSGATDSWLGYMEGAGGTGCYFLTFLGTDANDEGHGVGVDGSGNVYVTGMAEPSVGSQQWIATVGSHQPFHGGGTTDMYLMKLSSNGVLQWGTYYGGSGNESNYPGQGNYPSTQKLVLDGAANIYIAGSTFSTGTAIATTGSSHGNEDGFVAKFNSNGVRQWGVFVGASGDDGLEAIAVDATGNVYGAGTTASTSGLATPNAYQTTNPGLGNSMYAVKLNNSGVIQWCTHIGGGIEEQGYGLGVDGNKAVYVAGQTVSTSGLATTGAHQTTYSGNGDGFFAKLIDCSASTINASATETPEVTGQSNGTLTITATGGASPYQYKNGAGSFQSSNVFTGLAAGSYTITIQDANGCTTTITASVTQVPPVTKPSITGNLLPEEFSTEAYSTAAQAGATYTWTAVQGTITSGQGTNAIQVNWGPKGAPGSLKVVVSQGGPSKDSATVNITLTPSAINDVSLGMVEIYPNPVKDNLVIKMTNVPKGTMIKLYDNFGRLVMHQDAKHEQSINISTLPAGIYHLEVGGIQKNIQKL